MHKEDSQRIEDPNNAPDNTIKESQAEDHDSVLASSSSTLRTPGWTSRPMSRRALTTGLIAGGIGLIAGGIGLSTYLRSREPAAPIQPQPPESLVYTYRGHVHKLPKGIAVINDSFAFLAWLPQGHRIVSILNTEFINGHQAISSSQVWDAFNGKRTALFQFPTALASLNVPNISVNLTPPDGEPRLVWYDTQHKMFHITNLFTGKDLFTYAYLDLVEDTFPFVCSPDGRFAAMADPHNNSHYPDEIRILNLATKKEIAPLVTKSPRNGSKELAEGWCWSPDSQRLVSWYSDYNADLYVWRVQMGQVQTRYQKHRESNTDGYFLGRFTDIVWSPDNRLVASFVKERTGERWKLHVWNADTGSQLLEAAAEQASNIYKIQWSPDSQMLAVVVQDISYTGQEERYSTNVRVWSVNDHRLLLNIKELEETYIPHIQWSPNSQMLAVPVLRTATTTDKTFSSKIKVWQIASKTLLATKPTSSGMMAWTADSKQIISIQSIESNYPSAEELELWEVTTGRHIATYNDPTNRVEYGSSIAWSPDNQYVAVGVKQAAESGAIQVWKVR